MKFYNIFKWHVVKITQHDKIQYAARRRNLVCWEYLPNYSNNSYSDVEYTPFYCCSDSIGAVIDRIMSEDNFKIRIEKIDVYM